MVPGLLAEYGAGLPDWKGIPLVQFRRACIELVEFEQPANSVNINFRSMLHFPIKIEEKDAVAHRRAIDPPAEDFWTVHLIGAFYLYYGGPVTSQYPEKIPNVHGIAPFEGSTSPGSGLIEIPNTAFIFMEAIEDRVKEYNDEVAAYNKGKDDKDKKKEVDYSIFVQRVVAHEIAHLLYADHYSGASLMSHPFKVENIVDSDSDHLKFTKKELLAFQKITKPR
jgi:hypothetical protein